MYDGELFDYFIAVIFRLKVLFVNSFGCVALRCYKFDVSCSIQLVCNFTTKKTLILCLFCVLLRPIFLVGRVTCSH